MKDPLEVTKTCDNGLSRLRGLHKDLPLSFYFDLIHGEDSLLGYLRPSCCPAVSRLIAIDECLL